MAWHRIFIFVLITSLLVGCSAFPSMAEPPTEEVELTKIRLPMGFIPNVQYAPFYVAVQKGYFYEAGLDIEFDYSPETDGVALVGADELQFAVVSGEQVLLARSQDIPVVYFLAWWQDYPVGMVSMQEAQIKTPSDLAGRTIGIPGLYGASYIGFRALLNAGGLEEEDVTLESIGYNQVESLVAGQTESGVIYANNEPVQLEALGYDVDVIRVADYVQLASNGLISNEKTIAENPELVRKMAQATAKGIQATLDDPDNAFEICKNFVEGLDDVNQQVQRDVLQSSLEFWKTDTIGVSNPEAWENMQAVLLDMEMLSQPLDLESAFTNEFVAP
jgi:NitT/TauT family transport system substrate-binding protein